MSRRRLNPVDYINDMVEACDHILQFTAGVAESDFLASRMVQYAVIRATEVLGEASHQLQEVLPDAAARFPSVPFGEMYATRNRLIHGYSFVQAETIWQIATEEIPRLRATLQDVLSHWPDDRT